MFIFLSGTLTDRNAKQSHLKQHRQSLLPIPPPLLTPFSPFKLYPTKTNPLHRITRYRGFCLIWRTCCKEDCLLNFCYGNLSPYRFSRIRQKFFHPHHKRFSPLLFRFLPEITLSGLWLSCNAGITFWKIWQCRIDTPIPPQLVCTLACDV